MGARILVVDDSPTIRKVVSAILARHDYDTLAAEDGLEALKLLSTEGADLVLVDFVMPKMNGYQLCMSIRERAELAELPIVLMSAKGDKIRGKFVQQTGALDAITKPFDARGLVAVIESALEKQRSGWRASADEEEVGSSPTGGSSARTTRAALELSDRLSQLLEPEFRRQGFQISSSKLSGILSQALNPQVVDELASEVARLELGHAAKEALSGDLGAISIAEILQLLDIQRKTGALSIAHGKSHVTLHINKGHLDFATYVNLPEEFLLGRYLADTGALSREQLEHCIARSREAKLLLGDYLVENDFLSEEQLTRALKNQTSELVYEIVRWREGRFRFTQEQEDEVSARAQLGLSTGALVMEGFRRVDEWRLIEDSFDFQDVLFRDEMAIASMAEKGKLTADESRILAAVDGDATVGEILDDLPGSSFENCKVLYRLLNSRLVKRRSS